MPDGCRTSAHQKYIQSSRVRWFMMIMLGSLARIRSPEIITWSPSSFSTSACRHNAIHQCLQEAQMSWRKYCWMTLISATNHIGPVTISSTKNVHIGHRPYRSQVANKQRLITCRQNSFFTFQLKFTSQFKRVNLCGFCTLLTELTST